MYTFESRRTAIFSIVLTFIIMTVYAQVGNHQFINLDDTGYVTHNPVVAGGLTGDTIKWAFTTIDCFYWQPVTWLSHMADVQLYGMNPRGHHLTNVALHIIASLLVLCFFCRLTGKLWHSAFVAFLFALHPQSVESVAWVAERKDVLSAVFWFLSLIIYVEFTVRRKPYLYVLSLCSFMLGIMSKPMVVTLPAIMLLLDFWPLGRFRCLSPGLPVRERLDRVLPVILEKLPFIACSLFSAAITIYGHNQAGGLRNLHELPVELRLENALVSYVSYIAKVFLPIDLAVLYPFPEYIALWKVIGSLLVLGFITVIAVLTRRSQPYFAVGWFWFVLTLVPVIGLLQTGEQSMADRFSYIPRVGLFVMAAWGVSELTKGLRNRRAIIVITACLVIAASTALTWRQLGYWRDNISLFQRTLQFTTGNYTIHNNLGLALAEQGDLQSAIEEYQESIRIKPNFAFPHNNLGLALSKQGKLDAAIREYREALLIDPAYANAHNNLGIALAGQGDLDGAIRKYRDALRISPKNADAHYNLGLAYAGKGDFDSAIIEYNEALRITPYDSDVHINLGTAYAGKGQLDMAIEKFQKALQLNPDNKNAQGNLQRALIQKRMQDGSSSSRNSGR